jgi:gag-polypeptide of LTR copia-type
MSTQQSNAEFIETLDYEEPVEQEPEPIANVVPTAVHTPSVLQPWQPTIMQPSIAVQEPVVQSPYTPSGSLTLAAQSKLTDVNLGGLSMCKINPLKASNWISWKTWIHKFFQLFEISDVIHGVEPMPEDPILARKWLGKDGIAQALITNNINDQQMNHVVEATTSAEMWENLQSIHKTVGLASITAAKHRLLNTRAEDDTNIVEHINNLQEQHNALVNMGKRMSDQEFKSTMIMSLPESWDAFTTSYQGSNAK